MIRTFCCAIAMSMLVPVAWSAIPAPVTLSIEGMSPTFDNGLLRVSFNDDASARQIRVDGTELVASLSGAARDPSRTRSAYLDYHSGGVKDFKPERLQVIAQTPEMAHIAWVSEQNGLLRLEYHLIMRKGVKGIYSYVVAENTGPKTVKVSELRNVYRFDPSRLDHLYSGEQTARPERYAALEQLPKIQDETWRLPDGSIYSKYDFAGYQRAQPFWGVYGHRQGAWLIHASGEYFSGDAQKQELLVHQDAIILNYLTGAHFGTPDMMAPPGWKKLYGPWLLYFNQGDSEQMFRDARRQAFSEQVSWPYRWLTDTRYRQERTRVTGSVKADYPVTVQLSSSQDERVDQQTLGYVYAARADTQGLFHIDGVPPGDYRLTIAPNGAMQMGFPLEQKVKISGKTQSLGNFTLPSPAPALWSIGIADRKAGEFKFGDRSRNFRWHNDVPADLIFDTQRGDYSRDWYYAQTRPGTWTVLFPQRVDQPGYHLNIALAAASNSDMQKPTSPELRVKVNGHLLDTLRYENDKTLYRGALQSGRYHSVSIPVDAALLHHGENRVSLELLGGAVMYDAISFTE